jgi:hypothetical protein
MADSLDSPTGLAIVRALRASLRLVSSSSELLTISQLLAAKHDLCEMLAIVNGQIRTINSGSLVGKIREYPVPNTRFKGDKKVIIDLDDWEDTLDEGGKNNDEIPKCGYFNSLRPPFTHLTGVLATGQEKGPHELGILTQDAGTGTNFSVPAPSPSPCPTDRREL